MGWAIAAIVGFLAYKAQKAATPAAATPATASATTAKITSMSPVKPVQAPAVLKLPLTNPFTSPLELGRLTLYQSSGSALPGSSSSTDSGVITGPLPAGAAAHGVVL